MAGDRSARRSSRAKRARDVDSDDPEMSAAVQLTRLDGSNDGVSRESDRLAKIQEKNRKAQQKCAPGACVAPSACGMCVMGEQWTVVAMRHRPLHADFENDAKRRCLRWSGRCAFGVDGKNRPVQNYHSKCQQSSTVHPGSMVASHADTRPQ